MNIPTQAKTGLEWATGAGPDKIEREKMKDTLGLATKRLGIFLQSMRGGPVEEDILRTDVDTGS